MKICCKLEIVLPAARYGAAAQPGLSVDISSGGVCANTPCTLALDEEVDVVIDTGLASKAMGLPDSLRARARVRRVEPRQGGWQQVALAFAPAFAQSMEVAFYMAFLCGLQQADAAPAMG